MKCETAQKWMLQCEKLQPATWPRKVVKHVKHCAACYEFARSLKKIEKAWRKQPLPIQAKEPGAKFLGKIERLEKPLNPVRIFMVRSTRWFAGAAAAIIIVAFMINWLFLGSPEIHASAEVDRLLEWNTKLSAAKPEKRKEILEEIDDTSFRKRLHTRRLASDERKMAEFLLETGRRLANNDDLAEEEEILSELAEKLKERITRLKGEMANNKIELGETERADMDYSRFMDRALTPVQSKIKLLPRLIDWNSELANADPKKRKQLFDENEPIFRADLARAGLPDEEQAMAEKLLDLGRRLAANEPEKEVQTINEVAHKLLNSAENAGVKGRTKDGQRLGFSYGKFMESFKPFVDKKGSPFKGPPTKKGADGSWHFDRPWPGGPPHFARPAFTKTTSNFGFVSSKRGTGFRK